MALDLLLLAGLGIVLGVLGPYRTVDEPTLLRTVYWLAAAMGAGMVGIAADRIVGRRVASFWARVAIASLLISVRALAWRRIVETRTIVIPPLPEAERAFRMRLSPKRRAARLIAIEAE